MSRAPLISIVMPAYNVEKYIRHSIGSILAQTYVYWELLIADDASTDGTQEILKGIEDPRVRVYFNTQNLGYLRTCNFLFEQCNGAFITFQDADDLSHRRRLEIQVQSLHENPELALVGTWATLINEEGLVQGIDRRPRDYETILRELYSRNCFCGATMMFRKEVYQDIGGYRDYFWDLGYEDYDWSFRVAERYHCRNLDQPLYEYRCHPASVSRQISAKRAVSGKLVVHLAHQRRKRNGLDDLSCGQPELVTEALNQLIQPYEEDPALLYRDYAGRYLSGDLFKSSILSSLYAIKARPMNLINWRTLLYCLRISAWRSIKSIIAGRSRR